MKVSRRRSVNRFQHNEKGFTLIELLVVIAILGVLAAVVVPNVAGFMDEGINEAGMIELHAVQTAMTAMMSDLSSSLSTVTVIAADDATNDMTGFPDATNPLYGGTSNYVQKSTTEYYYSCDADGTVHGWWTDDPSDGEIGVVEAP